MSSSWMRNFFVPPLLEKLRFTATQDTPPFSGDASLLLLKQTHSRKHAFVVDLNVKEGILWLSDGFVTVNSIITAEAAQRLEQDSECVSLAQLRLGEVILQEYDLVLEHCQSLSKPKIVIHRFYYKGEIFSSLQNSLDLERDPTIGQLLDTFSKLVLGIGNYKREAIFLLSGLWKQVFDSSRRWIRFATTNDMLRLAKFVEMNADQPEESRENNSATWSTTCNDKMENEIDTSTAWRPVKQEFHEQSETEITTSSLPSSQDCVQTFTNDVSIYQQDGQSTIPVSTQDAYDIMLSQSEQNQIVDHNSPNDALHHDLSSSKPYCTQCWKRRKLWQTFSTAFQSHVDIAPVDDTMKHEPRQHLSKVNVFSMHTDESNDSSLVESHTNENEMTGQKKIHTIEELLEERQKWLRCSSIYSLITPKKRKASQDS